MNVCLQLLNRAGRASEVVPILESMTEHADFAATALRNAHELGSIKQRLTIGGWEVHARIDQPLDYAIEMEVARRHLVSIDREWDQLPYRSRLLLGTRPASYLEMRGPASEMTEDLGASVRSIHRAATDPGLKPGEAFRELPHMRKGSPYGERHAWGTGPKAKDLATSASSRLPWIDRLKRAFASEIDAANAREALATQLEDIGATVRGALDARRAATFVRRASFELDALAPDASLDERARATARAAAWLAPLRGHGAATPLTGGMAKDVREAAVLLEGRAAALVDRAFSPRDGGGVLYAAKDALTPEDDALWQRWWWKTEHAEPEQELARMLTSLRDRLELPGAVTALPATAPRPATHLLRPRPVEATA